MCLGFMLYYPRQELADCRSLPSLSTFMSVLGIESLYGNSFEKLASFLKDLGGTSSDGTFILYAFFQKHLSNIDCSYGKYIVLGNITINFCRLFIPDGFSSESKCGNWT